MNLHFLDAGGDLTKLRPWLCSQLKDAYRQVRGTLPLLPLDVVVRSGKLVIPEKGHVGYAPDARVIFLTVDPNNPALRENAHVSLQRMFVHELHHAARWNGPGYGSTLGEALVTEGLAGHFAQEVYGGPTEPWESVDPEMVRDCAKQALKEWEASNYGHSAWFYGAGNLPRWIGYSLGFQLVSRFLSANPYQKASGLVHADAQLFRGCLEGV
ncbi:DUF2268 domain-containing putative Zn-dependent protease [Paracoccus sp. Arc7-R13]|uniref:DUF2268 domain-containing putative Zn-dependent protease n=1 Tax=Paracoccus sp. Arc7-R13 TaxID=2500532 RepID=UPI00352D275D